MKLMLGVGVVVLVLALAGFFVVSKSMDEDAAAPVSTSEAQPGGQGKGTGPTFADTADDYRALQNGRGVKVVEREVAQVNTLVRKLETGKISPDQYLKSITGEIHDVCSSLKTLAEKEIAVLRRPVWPKELRGLKARVEKVDLKALGKTGECLDARDAQAVAGKFVELGAVSEQASRVSKTFIMAMDKYERTA